MNLFNCARRRIYAPCIWSLRFKNQFPHNITEYKNMLIRRVKIWAVFWVKENLVLQCSIYFNSHLNHITSSVVMTQNKLWQRSSVFTVNSKFQFLSRHTMPHCLSTYHAPLPVNTPCPTACQQSWYCSSLCHTAHTNSFVPGDNACSHAILVSQQTVQYVNPQPISNLRAISLSANHVSSWTNHTSQTSNINAGPT